ncbi:DUF4153 domain-containing protein [Rhodopseudomonas palustris]|uniref:DUF4153 domain-containing protein n=1 Tax=Rhodopseudomonas palustris TaxID=1076 RepID=UPI0020CD00AA|nr:DUF4153 domain-containing protein [Rhodopseudomonas palustris]
MTDTDDFDPAPTPLTFALRVTIGLLQGVALYALLRVALDKVWPATVPELYAALLVMAVFTPLVASSALTRLRPVPLLVWIVAVAAICAALGWYDLYRDPFVTPGHAPPRVMPAQAWVGLPLILFIAQSLLIAAAHDRRAIAKYRTYFEVSWGLGLQIALAMLFAGTFWGVLWLGADLFRLIKVEAFARVIRQEWFWIPATTVAISVALHVTDIRAGLVRGLRTVVCNLLGWLLPLAAAIVVAFVVALLFTGLDPLWGTKRAATILLIAAAMLVVLINTALQDGARLSATEPGAAMPAALRLSIVAASLVLLPLVALAGYAIALRVGQYGWSNVRIVGTAGVMVAACYAIGYAVAVARRRISTRMLASTNITTSLIVIGVALALLSPLADPARLSVADQVARLKDGRATPDRFSFDYLRFDTGRYGVDALRMLAQDDTAPAIRAKAVAALDRQSRWDPKPDGERIGPIHVAQPPGGELPGDFLAADWTQDRASYLLPLCLKSATSSCEAILVDLDGDGTAEIILDADVGETTVFRRTDGQWRYFGTLAGSSCKGVDEALRAGRFSLAPPLLKDIEVAGTRLRVAPHYDCGSVTARRVSD